MTKSKHIADQISALIVEQKVPAAIDCLMASGAIRHHIIGKLEQEHLMQLWKEAERLWDDGKLSRHSKPVLLSSIASSALKLARMKNPDMEKVNALLAIAA